MAKTKKAAKKYERFDRSNLPEITAHLGAALANAAAEIGLSAKLGRTTFDVTTFSTKVEVATLNADGDANSKEAEAFKCHAKHYGLKPEDLGREFACRGDRFRIIGLLTRARKYPILCERLSDGQAIKFGEHWIVNTLRAEDALETAKGGK